MTMRELQPAPVRKIVRVPAPPERAFDVFAKGIGRWWPPTHSLCRDGGLDTIIIEPKVGGRWYERGKDGKDYDVGRVLAWEPPSRLVLTWQLNGTWSFDPNAVSEVEVTFAPEPDGFTRVALEHRHIERMGETAKVLREQVDAPNGWGGLLQIYLGQVQKEQANG